MTQGILDTNLQEIRFSVEGSNNVTYAKVRRQSPKNPHKMVGVKTDYESVVQNITRFSRIRKERRKETPRIGVRMTDFEATRADIQAAVKFWKERADYVSVVPMLSWSGSISTKREMGTNRFPCIHLWDMQVISSDGTMVPCCIFVDTTGSNTGQMADSKSINLVPCNI